MKRKIRIAAKKKNLPRKKELKEKLSELVLRVLEAEGCTKNVDIVLADDETLARLNESFRARKGPTDVLSFPFEEDDFLGEIYVSLDRAARQAKHFGISYEEEVRRLTLHGLLHLLGYTHRQMPSRMKRFLR